jgi:hypothetical protein
VVCQAKIRTKKCREFGLCVPYGICWKMILNLMTVSQMNECCDEQVGWCGYFDWACEMAHSGGEV